MAACDLWHDSYVLVVLAVAALAVLGCVVAVALGHGGEMSEFPPDVPPLELPEAGRLTAVDFVSLRLPVALVGYHTQTVDETLRRAATALSERDTRIAILEQRVAELLTGRLQARQEAHAKPAKPPRTEHLPQPPRGEPAEAPGPAGIHVPTEPFGPADDPGTVAAAEAADRPGDEDDPPTEESAPAAQDGAAKAGAAKDGAKEGAPKGGAPSVRAATPWTGDHFDGEETW